MKSVIGTVPVADGTILRTRHWASTASASHPAGTVLIVHGLAEHSGRWEHVGEQFAAEGFDAHAYDLRGHGASAGRRVHLDRFDQFYADLAERLLSVRSKDPGSPLVLYGHSMGGLIALGYVLRVAAGLSGAPGAPGPPTGRPLPALLVLSAPSLDSTLPAWKLRLARVLGRFVPTLSIPNHIAGQLLSRDATVGERYHGDPLVLHAATTGFGALALAEQDWIRSSLGSLRLPTLVIHGADDALVPAAASAPLGDVTGVTRWTYPGIRHELHNEPEGPRIVADVIAWIKAALPAVPAVPVG